MLSLRANELYFTAKRPPSVSKTKSASAHLGVPHWTSKGLWYIHCGTIDAIDSQSCQGTKIWTKPSSAMASKPNPSISLVSRNVTTQNKLSRRYNWHDSNAKSTNDLRMSRHPNTVTSKFTSKSCNAKGRIIGKFPVLMWSVFMDNVFQTKWKWVQLDTFVFPLRKKDMVANSSFPRLMRGMEIIIDMGITCLTVTSKHKKKQLNENV